MESAVNLRQVRPSLYSKIYNLRETVSSAGRMNMRMRAMWAVLVCIVALSLKVESQVTTGTVSGTVTDVSGAVLPGVNIEITSTGTGIVRSTQSGSNGHYSIGSLPV